MTNKQKTPSQLRGEKIASLKEQVNAIIKEAEILGEAGEIDQAQAKLESCEKLKSECKYLEIVSTLFDTKDIYKIFYIFVQLIF